MLCGVLEMLKLLVDYVPWTRMRQEFISKRRLMRSRVILNLYIMLTVEI